MTASALDRVLGQIRPIDTAGAGAAAEAHTHRLTKPHGSLGELELLGIRLAAMARCCPPPIPAPATVCLFAADHGVVAAGVSPWPQEVTAQMVANFCAGGAAVNVLARQVGADVRVTDIGVATPIPGGSPALIRRPVRPGTANLVAGPAMSADEAHAALSVGIEVAEQAITDGARLLVTGEMGIGNTTAAAAVICAMTGLPAEDITGRGTGADDETLARKIQVVSAALRRLPPNVTAIDVLAELGGLEIAGMAGAMLAAAAAGVPALVDGVISAAAALVACSLNRSVTGYLIAGHRSAEPGSGATLTFLRLRPLLDLDMRLGEGSGAVLAIPLVQSAARVLRDMATFESARVDEAGVDEARAGEAGAGEASDDDAGAGRP